MAKTSPDRQSRPAPTTPCCAPSRRTARGSSSPRRPARASWKTAGRAPSVRSVAAAAGVSEATVYAVYGNKAGLARSLVDSVDAAGGHPAPHRRHQKGRWRSGRPARCLHRLRPAAVRARRSGSAGACRGTAPGARSRRRVRRGARSRGQRPTPAVRALARRRVAGRRDPQAGPRRVRRPRLHRDLRRRHPRARVEPRPVWSAGGTRPSYSSCWPDRGPPQPPNGRRIGAPVEERELGPPRSLIACERSGRLSTMRCSAAQFSPRSSPGTPE